MEETLSYLSNYIPADVELLGMLKFIGIFAAAVLALGFLVKLILGQKSELNHALSSAIGILFIYAVTIVIYTFNPYDLSRLLTPLPFVDFAGEYMILQPLTTTEFPLLCGQVLSMIILAFLVNLLDTVIPDGERLLSWFFSKAVCVVLAMGLHLMVTWAFDAFLPGVLATYAPMILLGILLILLFLGLLKLLLGLVLGIIDPIIGAVSGFFFSSLLGKQLSKAVLTTALLCGVVYLLEYTGYTVICISAAALTAYIPLIAALLVLWYVIGNIF